jgi:hypothetical protein
MAPIKGIRVKGTVTIPPISQGGFVDKFSYSLSAAAKTSAGIYQVIPGKSDKLIRTLWGGVTKEAGTYVYKWDKKLDNGTLAPPGNYVPKIGYGNVVATATKGIGNNSDAVSGPTLLRFFKGYYAMCVVKKAGFPDMLYCSTGYNEGFPSTFKTTVANPYSKTWIEPMRETNAGINFICANSENIFHSGYDPFDPDNWESFVFALKVSDDSRRQFTSGVPAPMQWGSVYNHAIDYLATSRTGQNDPDTTVSGMAVQAHGGYLFTSRKALNEIHVLNNTTGAYVRTIAKTSPRAMIVDNVNDNSIVWAIHGTVVEKFTINSDGTWTTTGISISMPTANGLSISPNGQIISISETDTGLVRHFNTSNGTVAGTLGRGETYIQYARAFDDKFYWKDTRQHYHTFLTYLPDGTLYVGDKENRRVQHFTAGGVYIDNIRTESANYVVDVDPNNTNHLYIAFRQLAIDWTKEPGEPGFETLVANWAGTFENRFDSFQQIKDIITYPNGKTYARLREGDSVTHVELVNNGVMRIKGTNFPQNTTFSKDGSKIFFETQGLGSTQVIKRYAITGYTDNWPDYSNTPEILATTPVVTANDTYISLGIKWDPLTDFNKVVFYNEARAETVDGIGIGYHLGFIERGESDWTAQTAKGTKPWIKVNGVLTDLGETGPFPTDGTFPNGNNVIYAGGPLFILGHFVGYVYHGEFYKDAQVNMVNLFHDSGLFVMQFGIKGYEHAGEEGTVGGGGNWLSGAFFQAPHQVGTGNAIVVGNDESYGGRVQYFKISGLDTFTVVTGTPTEIEPTLPEGLDLFANLVESNTLPTAHGWSSSRANQGNIIEPVFRAEVGRKTYDRFARPDVSVTSQAGTPLEWIARDLETGVNMSSWHLHSGQISWEKNDSDEPNGGSKSALQILDNEGKVICQILMKRDASIFEKKHIIFNNLTLESGQSNAFIAKFGDWQDYEVKLLNGQLHVKYRDLTGITSTLVDPTANIQRPAKLRWVAIVNVIQDNHAKRIALRNFYFKDN